MPDVNPACRLAARLLEPGPPPDAPDGCSPAELTRWLQRNKYPLLAVAPRAPRWLREDATFQHALAAEQEWYETQRREYALVRTAWQERGIAGLMIKSAGNAPSFPYTSDNIDILVQPRHGAAARDLLRRLGYVEVRNVEEPAKFLFRKFHDGRCVSAIHVHEQVAWFVGFMDEAALWARMRPAADDPLVNVPSPEDAVLINLAHACYENKLLRFNDVARIRHALRSTGGRLDWIYMEGVASSRGWLDGLAFLIQTSALLETALFGATLIPTEQLARCDELLAAAPFARRRLAALHAADRLDLPLDLSYWFCKRLYYRKILTDPTRTLGQRWRDALRTLIWGIKLKSGVRPQPGMIVAISGPDGSGKTAHARALADALRLCELQANYLWSRGGSTGLAQVAHHLRRILGAGPNGGNEASEDHLARRRRRLAHPFARFAWAWLVAADQVGSAFLNAYLPARLGRIVVADRYVYDTAVEMDLSLPADARWSRRAIAALLALAPRPRLAYVLDVSAEVARERKPDEVWHADLEGERQRYRALAERWGLRLLSNEGCFAETNDPLIRQVIMDYMADFETWLNALFLANPSQKNAPDLVWARGGAR